MKKLTILSFVLISIASMASSCTKCSVCTSQSLAGETVKEYCGTELDVRDFEKFFVDSVTDIMEVGYCERGPDQ